MDFKKILRLISSTDLNNSEIARLSNTHRGTVAKYRRCVHAHPIDTEDIDRLTVAELKELLQISRPATESRWTEPDWDEMASRLSQKGMVMSVLHDDYARQAASPMHYVRFCRKLKAHIKKRGPVMRQIRVPGEEVFVDFAGKRPQIGDLLTGKSHFVELFIGALGYSRLIFAIAVPDQRTQSWIKALIAMFEYFGGSPKFIVPDNLKAAVIRTRTPTNGLVLNATFDRAMQHYGAIPLPARKQSPRDKGLVEQSVLHANRWITLVLSRQVFHSITELNEAIRVQLERINEKPMRRMAGLSRRQIFEAEEKSCLRPLPHRAFRNLQHVRSARIPEDYHIEHAGNFYSVPHELIGKTVELFEDQDVISIFHIRQRVAVHPRQSSVGKVSTLRHHQPENHRFHGEHRNRYFYTWGRYQAIPIDRYLRRHLEQWSNPNATDLAARKLAALIDAHGEELVVQAADWVLTHCADALHVKRIERLVACPALMDSAAPDGDEEPIDHQNIRGARYYGGKSK